MFTVHCDICDNTYLLGNRRITAIDNTGAGIVVHFDCPRGHDVTVLTGRAAEAAEPAVPLAAHAA